MPGMANSTCTLGVSILVGVGDNSVEDVISEKTVKIG